MYEEKYIQPGILIYREDFKQFLKIIPNQGQYANTFTFIASDENKDNPEEHFRVLTYCLKVESPLYPVFYAWMESMSSPISYSILPLEEGFNQIQMQEKEGVLYIHFIKDVRHSRNLYSNVIKITLGGNGVKTFFSSLPILEEVDNKDYVLQKMLYLKPKNKDAK